MTTQTLPEGWLDKAADYGSTKWLRQFIWFYLAQLEAGSISAAEFADELEQEFESRRLTKDSQQKNYRSNVVMALKQLDPHHPAIGLVSLSTEQYRVLNDEQKERVADRETRFIHHEDVDRLVEQAATLIDSREWPDVGAGLAVLIGRRISEIILSDFTWKTSWSLAFSQMAKKAEDVDIIIEIPTLAPTPDVLEAINRLQHYLGADIDTTYLSPREAKRLVNNRYSGAIAGKCEEHFSGLVPNRSDKDNLYSHIFRAVYATIAAHWYCPPSVPEHQFKSEIQGHFSFTQDGKKLPNYSARSNYDDYAIGDGHGNRDGQLGIKLGQVEGLQVIEAFRPDDDAPAAIADDDVPANDKAIEVLDFIQLPHWIEVAASHVTTQWLRQFLRHQLPQLVHEILSPQAFADALADALASRGLRQSHQQHTYREQVVRAIREGFHDHPVIPLIACSPHATQTVEEAPATTTQPAEADRPQPRNNPMALPAEDRPTKRPSVYAEDLERMNRLMFERNVSGSTAEVFRALLETFVAETQTTKRQQVETMDNFAQTLNWFTQRVSQLEQERDQLRQERDRLQAQQGDTRDTDEIDQLREHNAQLEQELQQTQSRLNSIHTLLGGNGKSATTSQPVTADTPETTTTVVPPQRTVTTAPTLEKDEPPTRKRDLDESVANITDIVDAIIKWNTAQERSEMRLQISFPTIKSLAVLVNSASHPAIRAVMKQKGREIDEIHERYMMGSRHNRSVKDKDGVLKAIARDYLGLSNWEDAEYTN